MPRPSGYTKPGNWETLKAAVLARDGYRCYLCDGQAITADHVLCVAQGGTHDMSNLAAICGTCHTKKTERERVAGLRSYRQRVSRKRPPEKHPGHRK